MTVEIIGYAAVAPGAGSASQLFDLLRRGECAVTEVPADRWDRSRFWHPVGSAGKTYTFAAGVVDDIDTFDARIFGLSRREAMAMDPQQRLLLSVTWRALEDANLSISSLQKEAIGVYIGASSLDGANLSTEDPAAGGPYFMTGNTLSIVANRISHIFGLSGPSLTIDTACSSSLVALDQAVRALNRGEIDTAIVGGVNLLIHPLPFVGFAQARMLSPEGRCRAYDNDASGYVRAEGAVAVVLRRSDRVDAAGDRSRARILATGVNSAGRTNGISLPSQEAQARLLQTIYADPAIDPNHVAFIEGHGTGTKVGDPAEVWAIGQVLGQKRHAPIPLGSIKTNIGHTEPASGLFGVLKAVMALEHDYLPASLFFDTPNDAIDFNGLNVSVTSTPLPLLRSQRPRLAGINSFGFGGTNAHVVVSDPVSRQGAAAGNATESGYFMVSAHTETALRTLLEDYRDRLAGTADQASAPALVAAATAGRTPMRHRFVTQVRKPRDIVAVIDDQLAGLAGMAAAVGEAPVGEPRVAFVFAGNGAQWAGMGVDALRTNPDFRRHFSAISALFEDQIGEKLTALLVADDLAERLADTRVAQPLLFSIQVALAQCLIGAGIRPAAVLGHSIGEVAAAHIAGALSLVDAVAVVAVRSRCQHITKGKGTMAAALCGEEAARDFIRRNGLDGLTVAAVNAGNSVTISGPKDEIAALRTIGRRQKLAVQLLEIDYPFHHPLVDEAKEEFLRTLPKIAPRATEYDFISTVTGERIDGIELDGAYWWRNVREPVYFMQGVAQALAQGCNLLMEISPRPILTNYLKDAVKTSGAPAQLVPTLDKSEDTGDPVANCIIRALAHGAALPRAQRNAVVDLPGIPFEPECMTGTPTTDSYDLFGRHMTRPYSLAGWRADPNSYAWKNHLDARLFPDLAEHVVDGRAIMPGAGFIEIALQVAQQALGTEAVQLTNIELLRPLELGATMVELSTVISRETGTIEIRSRERLSADDWTLHVVCRCQKVLPAMRTPALEALGPRAEDVSPERIYTIASSFGLDYGPAFRLATGVRTDQHKRIDVVLSPGAAPAHPMLAWGISPMLLDAAFHGLVGLFDRFSGDAEGAPYIPVHFGSVALLATGVTPYRARIEVQRVSAHSIKARFVLETEDGRPVVLLEDCRFRRTWLQQHHTPASLTFHYEAVPVAEAVVGNPSQTAPAFMMTAPEPSTPDDASLLLQAAVLRACHDIVLPLVDAAGRLSPAGLPGDRAFQDFLSNALYLLSEAGLASQGDGVWTVQAASDLPETGETLAEFTAERPDRGAEAVLLAEIRAGVLRHIDYLRYGGTDALELGGKTMRQALRLHSPQARERNALVFAAAEKAVADGARHAPVIVQVGATAPGFSRRLADLAARAGGKLVIVEPSDDLRRAAEVAFATSGRVTVAGAADALRGADVIVSTCDRLHAMLDADEALSGALAAGLANGARLLAAETPASLLYDFFFGLTSGWFANGLSQGFPVGRLASEGDWKRRLSSLGAERNALQTVQRPYGSLLLIEVSPAVEAGEAGLPKDTVPFLPLGAVAGSLAAMPAIDLHQPVADLGESITQALAAELLLYVAPAGGADDEAALARDAHGLSKIVEALQASNAKRRPKLVLLLPGGAPDGAREGGVAPSPLSTGLWTFARVLANEFSEVDVHLVDAGPDDWQKALDLAAAGHGEREWRIVDGGRHAEAFRAVSGPVAASDVSHLDFAAATVRQRAPSRVDSLYWESMDRPEPAAGEVLVEVAAAGLNFRDVMWAMGLLPEEALEDGFAGATIGMEFSGRVAAVGKGVDDLAVGDRVMGIGPAAFSTHTSIRRAGLAKLPDELDLVAAATVPVTFLTAWYALVELGRARAGETLLIHGAAGGVGLAAIQIAKVLGLTIIGTAGSDEKRSYLRSLGVDMVFDSRSLSFVADVKAATGGEGVDLVLNSLFSDAMERSIELVKPFGRFLELGKRDYYADRKIGLRPFRRNVSYFGIDADQLPLKAPALTKAIFADLGALFAKGDLRALPYRTFKHDEIADAFRLMQNAGHIGKIVLLPPQAGQDAVAAAAGKPVAFDPDGIHVVVGGIGGFGLSAADWLAARGARRLALVTRRGTSDAETDAAIAAWKKRGISASLHACDVTDAKAVDTLLAGLRRQAPVKGVVHAAMVLDDALLPNLTEERFRRVIDVKARGAAILDKATRKDKLDYFLMFSSATTMIGNPGQGNYVAANGYLEGLARARRAEGLAGLAVAFGAISDRGYLARNDEVGDLLARRIGNTAMKAATALAMVEAHMRSDPGTVEAAVVVCSPIDWAAARNLKIVGTPLFEVLLRQAGPAGSGSGGDTVDLTALVAEKGEAEALDALYALVAEEMATILRVPESSLGRDKVLKDVGLDSLMAVELALSFKEKTGFDIPITSVGDTTTIETVVRNLYEKVARAEEAEHDGEEIDHVEALAEQHMGSSPAASRGR
ncbi:SDR family NAD(P)-dependent oxidoreductase [Shinella zoogloeoides]|uniref:SDR family NAD(P)-dependent oxidoreductase n=1 Tax=Shinella zoogloeoides TaxID=352475 RepID=UPI00273EAAC6|nr:SDR family NAD(P)-dependent oxidoreductase [Shinella zoogloeoides]WLR93289.1 SDR family NAD(P)-dependent oxidoreductase [Shinella zoogloeoides]